MKPVPWQSLTKNLTSYGRTLFFVVLSDNKLRFRFASSFNALHFNKGNTLPHQDDADKESESSLLCISMTISFDWT